MAVLFEYFEDVDLPAERKKAREEGHAEGHAEGLAEGRAEGRVEGRVEGREEGLAEGRAEGQDRLRRLTKALIEQKRLKDLERSTYDPEYLEELYREFHI